MKSEELTFVNDEPAECGCEMEFSDGHGEYSNVVRIKLCRKHRKENYDICKDLYNKIKDKSDETV